MIFKSALVPLIIGEVTEDTIDHLTPVLRTFFLTLLLQVKATDCLSFTKYFRERTWKSQQLYRLKGPHHPCLKAGTHSYHPFLSLFFFLKHHTNHWLLYKWKAKAAHLETKIQGWSCGALVGLLPNVGNALPEFGPPYCWKGNNAIFSVPAGWHNFPILLLLKEKVPLTK